MKTYVMMLCSLLLTTAFVHSQNSGFTKVVMPQLNTGRIDARAALVADGRLVVFGGHIPGFHRSNTAESIKEGDASWTAYTMADYRDNSAIVHLGDSRYLLAGGMSSSLGVGQLATTEIYDATTNQFTAKASMKVARGNCRAALLTSGKALIVGNWYADATKAEVYDPVTNTFTLTSAMVKDRASCYVVPLPDGRIVVAGGRITNNFDAHPHCFIVNPIATATGNEEVNLNNEALKVYAETNLLRVVSSGVNAGNQQLSIIDFNGRLQHQIQVKVYEGINSVNLPVTLSKGIYILRLGNQSARFIVR